MSDFDANKFAAEVFVQASEVTARRISESGAVDRVRRLFQSISDAYSPFLEKTYRRVSTIRTFLRPNESVDLLDAYVPVDLTDNRKDITIPEFMEKLLSGSSFVVCGLAGRGKSVLMRYVALMLYHYPRGRIPLFLELRSINALTSKNVLQLIHSQYKGESSITFSDFTNALANGYFCLLLDGFDEVSPDDRQEIERQVLEIAENYPACPMIVSGRPDQRFSSWEAFAMLHLKAMNRSQALELIDRANYDDDVKKKFTRRLNQEFFERHESFLSTPLLAIMLMLTFQEYAEIPHSLHEFYRNAFDTLVRRHDAMKSQFLRATHSGCTADEFKRVFASFCVLTYSKNIFSFNREEGVNLISLSLKQQGIKVSAEWVLDDLIESVCLLQEEGFYISFVHRSFQEYFCAVFLSTAPSGVMEQFLDSKYQRPHDDVVPMLYGINPERFEEEWARDAVKALLAKFPLSDSQRYMRFLMAVSPEVTLSLSGKNVSVIYHANTDIGRRISLIENAYAEQFNGPRRKRKVSAEEWCFAVLSEARKLEQNGVDALKGVGAAMEARSQGLKVESSFAIIFDERMEGFARAVQGRWFEASLKGLDRISRLHRQRAREGSDFLSEIFLN